MQITIKDSTTKEEIALLIRDVFILNNIGFDYKDYAAVRAESVLIDVDQSFNSYLYVAPLVTNSELPKLKLSYNRRSIDEVLGPLNPSFAQVVPEMTVKDLLKQINNSLENNIVLYKEDFYDTFVVINDEETFVELHSHPTSYFYTGHYKVPLYTRFKPVALSFRVFISNYLLGG